MSNNNYSYVENYSHINNRQPNSQSSQQSFPTSNAKTGSYYGFQASAAPARTYPNADYQYGQYSQQNTSNNGGGYNWGVYSTNRTTTPGTGDNSLRSLDIPEQRANAGSKPNVQNSYDSSGLGNLAYASTVNYGASTEVGQQTTHYSSTNLYGGTIQSNGNSAGQRHTQSYDNRAASASSRTSQAATTQAQRRAPEQAPRANAGTAFNLPTPSPTYPQSLINTYPAAQSTTSLPRASISAATSKPSNSTDAPSLKAEQPIYAPSPSYYYAQPQTATREPPEQARKTQTPTPLVRSSSRNAGTTNSSIDYGNQSSQSQFTQLPVSQSASAPQARPQPNATLSPTATTVNAIRRTGDPKSSSQHNINSQTNTYQPTPPPVAATQNRPTQNYLPHPLQATSSGYPQQPAAPQRQPSPDRPTTVDPNHVYNRYHEYQKQIEAAEAEEARLAKINEEQNAAEAARAAEQLRQDNLRAAREAEEAAAAEAAKTLAQTMPADKADESESESEEEEEKHAEDNGDEDYEPSATGRSENTPQNTIALIAPSNPASNEQPNPAVATQAPAQVQIQSPSKDDAESMEEEMRRMVEKLRDYQSKDPKLFLQVWSSVRKSGGGAGQSPQSQAEGSLARRSPSTRPAEVPQATPSPAVLQSEAPPNPPVEEAVHASNLSSTSPVTSAQEPMPRPLSRNARRRANRPSRSKAAIAERAAARAALIAAGGAIRGAPPQPSAVAPSNVKVVQNAPSNSGSAGQPSSAPPAIQAPQPVAHGQPTPASVGTPAAKQGTQLSSGTTSAARPALIGIPAANQKPRIGAQATPPASTTSGGQPSSLNPSAKPPPRPGATWPNEQRDLIANTASTVLNAIPENAGKTIQSHQIRAMLEDNPSYMELCQMIEKMGFKMDRARFAKTLLAVIPHSSTRNPPTSGPAQPSASGAARNRVVAYSTSPVSYGNAPSAVAQTSTQQTSTQAASTAVMSANASGSPGGISVSTLVGQPIPPSGRRPRGRPRKDGQPPHSKPNPPNPIQPRTSSQAIQQETVISTPQNPPSPSDPQPQNQKGSTPLSSKEIQQMSLLQDYVRRKPESTGPLSGGAANDNIGRETQAYRSPYERQSQPGLRGPAAARSNPRPLPVSYAEFWNTNQRQAPPVNHQQGQESQPQNQPPATNQSALPRYPAVPHYYSTPVGSSGQARVTGVPASYSSPIPIPIQPLPGKPQGNIGGSSKASHILPVSQPQQVPNAPLKPLTKAEAARKRTFAEIIDLTKEAATKETVTCETGNERESKRSRIERNNNFPSPGTLRVPQPPQNTTSLNQPTTYQQFFEQHSHHVDSRPATPQVQSIRNPLLEFDGIVKPLDSSVALRRSRYNPKTIARDVLISTGRHPTQRGLNAHLEQLKGRFLQVDNSSDLSTFRWDIVDPGGLPVGSANMETLSGLSGYSSSHASMRGPVQPSRGGSYSLTSAQVVPSRPSGLRNEIDHASEFAVVIPATASASAPTPKRRGRPPRDPNAAETPKRPLGRPRKIPIIEQQTPTHVTVDEPIKRRGRPPRSAQKPVSRLSMPSYQAFLCEWKGCKAELLNLETLRKHVFNVHGKTGVKDGIRCRWGKCADEVIDLEDDTPPENVFRKTESWKEHVEKKHLIPLAWHMGDGPRGSTLDGNESDHSSYLLDSTGYQVTPSILDQAVESGSAAANNERRAAERAARAQKKFNQRVYWCGPTFVAKPAIREGDFPPRDADFEWQDPYRMLEEEYGDELRRAAKESQGLAPENRVRVYSKYMPEELRRRLGVEG